MNPFLSTSWLQAWKKTSRVGKSLVFWEAGDTLGIVTLNRAFRVYANGGLNRTNLVESHCGEELLSTLMTHLRRGVLLMFDVPQNGELARVLKRQGAYCVPLYPALLIRLDPSFERYTDRQFSSKNRQEFKRRVRRLQAMGELDFRVYNRREDRSEIPALLDRFFAILNERFQDDKKEYNFYTTPRGQEFIRSVITSLLGEGVILPVLSLDGIPISFSLCYIVDKRLISSIAPYDTAFSKCGLGQLHLHNTIAWSFQQGFEIFDLSKGSAPYKALWANDSTWLSLYILPLSQSTMDLAVARLLESCFRLVTGLRRRGVLKTLKRARSWLDRQFDFASVGAVRAGGSVADRHGPSEATSHVNYRDVAGLPVDLRRRVVDAAFHATNHQVRQR